MEGVIKLSQLVSELANEKMDWAKLSAVADYAEVRSAKNLNNSYDEVKCTVFNINTGQFYKVPTILIEGGWGGHTFYSNRKVQKQDC